MGTPTVNGTNAGAPDNAVPVAAGQPATVTVPVTNTGTSTVGNVTSTTPSGAMTCYDSTLTASESTVCTGPFTPAADTTAVPVTVTGTTANGEQAGTTGTAYVAPAPDPAGNGSDTGCSCHLTMGTPTVNGTNAGAPDNAVPVAAGQPATVTVPVTNTGTSTVGNVSGATSIGAMTCADSTLAAKESTLCTGTVTPAADTTVAPVTVTGTTANGEQASATGTAYLAPAGPAPVPAPVPAPAPAPGTGDPHGGSGNLPGTHPGSPSGGSTGGTAGHQTGGTAHGTTGTATGHPVGGGHGGLTSSAVGSAHEAGAHSGSVAAATHGSSGEHVDAGYPVPAGAVEAGGGGTAGDHQGVIGGIVGGGLAVLVIALLMVTAVSARRRHLR
ncbi:hypothetical protein NQK81_21195 [Amycolatopsis roodepoortensis]|uniref:hypothetical protein n=1 Tax=Amycolatopsis roodepoortensis TaxID=700274 RepID=UPI00214BB69A|nr:hypothetical protein [Amycolatopsis roodepoortensis]UUV35850.1 hypothetical protein NQK81_21195 [Amycolatopsis roodepoortensis]